MFGSVSSDPCQGAEGRGELIWRETTAERGRSSWRSCWGDHRRGGGAADGAGHRRRNAAVAGGEGARRPREGGRCGAAGARTLEPPARDARAPRSSAGREAYEQARSGQPADSSGGGRVNDWSQAFLGVIAVSTALMAVMQIGAFVVLARVATQVRDIVATLQKDIRPLIAPRQRDRRGGVARPRRSRPRRRRRSTSS